ncbi:hypothetical protein BLL52_3735 [Rhodoferax antarcticus ANT.BR]|uniref:Uncharacterized protein n=1 Tax=Rhodoferax antarcticus ANT.BR TaxID=1111071 RepID=A0A1Q8YA39_9BURK|nr:hypothetical protein BLL52_3735 [Rhodoferax antarcticus ANT.BR]
MSSSKYWFINRDNPLREIALLNPKSAHYLHSGQSRAGART